MILAAIARTQAKRGDHRAVKATLAEAVERADRRIAADRREPLCWIVDAYVAAGELDEATRAATRSMPSIGSRHKSLSPRRI